MKIAVIGACGKLGSQIVNECKKDQSNEICCIDTILNNNLDDNYDIVIDASTANQSVSSAKYCGEHHIALLVACTGQTSEQLNKIDQYCKNIAYCICPNLSQGINFIFKSLENLQILKNMFISITETHHIHKQDKPSGTAIAIKHQIEKYGDCSPTISSIRQGDEIGQHQIKISLPYEEIVISHKVLNRNVFAQGAMFAIQKLSKLPPKKYSFFELLENNYD